MSALVACSVLAACSDDGDSSDGEITVIKATPSFGDLPLHIIEEVTGPEHGLTVTSEEFEGAVAGNAFASGGGDFLVAGIDKPVLAKSQELFDPMIIGSIMNSNVWVVVAPSDSDITTMADLDGKKISISGPGGVSDAFMRWNLINEGIDPDNDVELIGLGEANAQFAALEEGQVDAATLLSPVLEDALGSGDYRIVDGGDWREVKFPALVVATRQGDYEEYPETTEEFQAALADAMDMIQNDPGQAASIAAEQFDISEQEAAELIKAHLPIWQPALEGELTPEAYESSVDIMDTAGLIPADSFPDYESVILPRG